MTCHDTLPTIALATRVIYWVCTLTAETFYSDGMLMQIAQTDVDDSDLWETHLIDFAAYGEASQSIYIYADGSEVVIDLLT